MDLVKLSKISHTISKGTTPTTLGHDFIKAGIPFLRAEDVTNDAVKIRNVAFHISPKTHDYLSRSKLQAGDFLITIAGTLGRVGYVPADAPSLNCNQAVAFARLDFSKVDLKYLFLICQSSDVMKNLLDGKKVGTIGNLNLEQIGNLLIPLPKLDEQKRIAAILDKAGRLRRQYRFAQTLSDSFLQSIFIKMFGDPVSNPMNWDVSLLSEACVPKDGIKAGPFGSSIKKESYSETGYRVYGQEQVIVDDYRVGNYRISEKKFQEMKTYAVQPDDVLISLVGTFGKVSIVPTDAELGIINPRLIRIRLNQSKLTSQFFAAMFRNQAFLRKMSVMSHGGTMGILNGAQLRETEIILPPLPLQEKFADIVQKFERIRRQQLEATRQAEHLFQTLLHRAFRREL